MAKTLDELSAHHYNHRIATYAMLLFLVFISAVLVIFLRANPDLQVNQAYKSSAQEQKMTNTGATNPFNKAVSITRRNDTNVVRVAGGTGTLVVKGPYTVEAWIKPKTYPSDGYILSKTQSSGVYPPRFLYPFRLSMYSSKPNFSFLDVGESDPSYPISVTSDKEIDSFVWHHIAATVDTNNGTVRLFVDGLLKGEKNLNRQLIVNDPDKGMAIGATPLLAAKSTAPQPFEFRNHFIGEIDDVRISDTIRYPDKGFSLPRPHIVDDKTLALYHFDDRTGTDYFQDETGKNHGQKLGWITQVPSDLDFYLKNPSFENVNNKSQPKFWTGKNLDTSDKVDSKYVLSGAGTYSFVFTPAKKGLKQISQTLDHKGQDEAIILYLYSNVKGELAKNSVGAVIKVQYTDANGKKSTYSVSKTFTNATGEWSDEKLQLVTDRDRVYDWARVIVFSSNPNNNSQFRVDNLRVSITSEASKNGLKSTPSSLSQEELQLID